MSPRRSRPLLLILAVLAPLAGCGPASALLHNPKNLPCLPEDCAIRYEPGAEKLAAEVGKTLARDRSRIEAFQGRPFGAPVTVVAYADEAHYAQANGRGSTKPSGVTFNDRVSLSPRLAGSAPEEVEIYLTHELSHAHMFSHLSVLSALSVPAWFTEGLAVAASGGGGAQKVPPAEARAAIRAGQTIETPGQAGLFGQFSLPAAKYWSDPDPYRTAHMAYRQAGMFVDYLRDKDRAAFARLLNSLFAGEKFGAAFERAYGTTVAVQWRDFVQQIAEEKKS